MSAQGTVKWFNNAKGYGFILSADNAEDIFAHYSAIEMDGYKSLKAGQQVSFEIRQGQKGVHAAHIRPVGSMIVPDYRLTLPLRGNGFSEAQ